MLNYEILLLAIFINCIPLLPMATSKPQCCDDGVNLLNRTACKNNKKALPSCRGFVSILDKNWTYIINYDFGDYLDVWMYRYIVREPGFCVGTMNNSRSRPVSTVVLVCSRNKIYYYDVYAKTQKMGTISESVWWSLYQWGIEFLNSVSLILLAITALLYYLAPAVQDTDGICTFHLTLCMCLTHCFIGYYWLFHEGVLPSLCITNLYLLTYATVAIICWFTVISFNLWNCLRVNQGFDKFKLILYYRLFGYGAPALLLFTIFIGAHVSSLYTNYRFETSCMIHELLLISIFLLLPLTVLIFANFFFFFDAHRRLGHEPFTTQKQGSLLINIIRHRLILQTKIFLIVGIPWTLFVTFILAIELGFSLSYSFYEIIIFLISVEGILIFLVVVVGRGRMRKFIARKLLYRFDIVPEKWKTEEGSEISQESKCEELDVADADGSKQTDNEVINNAEMI